MSDAFAECFGNGRGRIACAFICRRRKAGILDLGRDCFDIFGTDDFNRRCDSFFVIFLALLIRAARFFSFYNRTFQRVAERFIAESGVERGKSFLRGSLLRFAESFAFQLYRQRRPRRHAARFDARRSVSLRGRLRRRFTDDYDSDFWSS